MNFAGKAYLKKKPIIPVPSAHLSEEKKSSELNAENLAVLNDLPSSFPPVEKEEVKQPPRLRRNRSFERLSYSSLNHSLHSMSDDDEEEEADLVLGLPDQRAKVEMKIDTNVVSLDLTSLKKEVVIATGDPIFCLNCKAIFNLYSGISEDEAGCQLWTCEFCSHLNPVDIDAEEVPRGQMVDYMLMSSSQVIEEKKELDKSAITVVFCVDISGSMCVTEPVRGQINLKNKKKIDLGGFADFLMDEQYLQGDNQVTYVSRLECVQAAIEAQFKALSLVAPNQKVALITFNHEVTLYGDGSGQAALLAGDKLNHFEACFNAGVASQHLLQNSIGGSLAGLNQKLYELNETGPTALGPALIAAIGQASQGLPGSRVIICTDGLANVGIGRLDEAVSDQFYQRAADIAKDKGIEVSVISIEGEECKLSMLSVVSELTGGEITRVNMGNIVNEFANILETPVIATQVSAVIKLHKGLKFRYQDDYLIDENTIQRHLGNVSEGSEFTFEYQMRDFQELENLGINIENFKQLPFQSQIHYTNREGSKCIRVITAMQDTTDDLDEAGDIDLKVIGVNAAQRSAHLASKGEYRESQAVMRSWKRMMKRNVNNHEQGEHLNYYLSNMSDFNQNINSVAKDHEMLNSEERVQSQKDKISHMAFRAKRAQQDNKKACLIM
jgi:hypothetical protein